MKSDVMKCIVGVALVALLLHPPAALAQDARQNTPGQFDFYVLSLSWSPSFCAEAAERRAMRSAGAQCGARPYSFVVHGLWPQYDKGFPEYCEHPSPRLNYGIVSSMLDLMPAPHLIFNEWDKHGTCSGLAPRAYFETVRKARAAVKIPPEYIDLQQPLNVTPGACGRCFRQGQSRAFARGHRDQLRQDAADRGPPLPVEGSAVSRLRRDRPAQLQARSIGDAAGARRLTRAAPAPAALLPAYLEACISVRTRATTASA